MPDLAKKTGTNPFTLKKVFKKYYGISVFQFSRQQRIDHAKELLRQTNYTLQTIGEMVGYLEGNNFQVAFKPVRMGIRGIRERQIVNSQKKLMSI